MGALEQVINLKRNGFSENEIAMRLGEQGFYPQQINDALNQARIKEAVSSGAEMEMGVGQEGMEQSVGTGLEESYAPTSHTTNAEIPDESLTPPQPSSRFGPGAFKGPMRRDYSERDIPWPEREGGDDYAQDYGSEGDYDYPENQEQGYPESNYPSNEQSSDYEEYPEDYENYSQQDYPPQDYEGGGEETGEYSPQSYEYQEYPQGSSVGDTDITIEIAEQVFLDKSKKIQEQLDKLNEFKTTTQTKVDNISDRLKRIEANIDSLQSEILERVGAYGRGLDGVKQEMSMMQDSFGKVVNTLADKSEKKLVRRTRRTKKRKVPNKTKKNKK
ncbi:hypothetical protein K0A97_02480 [Patescibacteria group bacterium]|nr:hypothetical protein [Patescibacteria group bacterium]